MNHWPIEETDDPLKADVLEFYKVVAFTVHASTTIWTAFLKLSSDARAL